MKKTLLFFVAIVFVVSACDKTTTVHVTYDELDSHGWNAFVEFVLSEDGESVSKVDFDYLNADGIRKSEDSTYNANMLAFGGGITNPEAYCPQIEEALASATIDPQFDDIDVVVGATHSTENANALFKAGLEAAVDGEYTEITIPQPVEEEEE